MEKREPFYTVGGNVNCCSHYGEQYGDFSRKLKIQLLYRPTISILETYSEKVKTLNVKRNMHPDIHSSTIYNSQDMEATLSVIHMNG